MLALASIRVTATLAAKSTSSAALSAADEHAHAHGGSCDAVVAHFASNMTTSVAALTDVTRVLASTPCRILVYDKSEQDACAFMGHVYGIASCEPLENRGREQATYAHHVARHYDSLPAWLILVPSDLKRWRRGEQLASLIDDTDLSRGGGASFRCMRNVTNTLNQDAGCEFYHYYMQNNHGGYPERAEPKGGLWPWLDAHVARNSPQIRLAQRMCNLPVCDFGLAITERRNLLAHPQRVYADVAAAVAGTGSGWPETGLTEATFLMELSMAALYGALSSPASCATYDPALVNGFCDNTQADAVRTRRLA